LYIGKKFKGKKIMEKNKIQSPKLYGKDKKYITKKNMEREKNKKP